MDDRETDGAALAGTPPAGSGPPQVETSICPVPHSASQSEFGKQSGGRRWLRFFLDAPVRWTRRAWSHPGRFLGLVLVALVLAVGIWVLSWRAYGWHHLLAGKRSLQADHCHDSLDHFQAALEIWPDDAAILFLAARAARRAGDLDAADRYLTQCQATPSIVDAAAFERVLLRATRGEIDAVGGFCEALLEEGHPDTPLILEALALGELRLLHFTEASTFLNRWLKISPDHPQALFLMGRLHVQANNTQEAISFLGRTVELDPERDDARLLLASQYLDLGQAQEALPHLEIVRRRRPHLVAAQALLAQALVLLGRDEEAIRLFDDVLEQRPDMVIALLERGKLALRDGQLDQAENWLQKACKRDLGNRAAHYQLFQCLKRRDKATEARVVKQRLDQIDQDSARLQEIIKVDLRKRPNDPDLPAELGELYLSLGAVDEGVDWLNRALKINPHQASAHRALAKHYQALGQSGKAQQHRALAGPPDKAAKAPK